MEKTSMRNELNNTLGVMCKAVVVAKDNEAFYNTLGEKMNEVKTVKNSGSAKATNNATFIIRLAKNMGIKHSRIDAYYKKGNTTGINAKTDKVKVLEVFKLMLTEAKSLNNLCQLAFDFVASHFDEEEEEEEEDAGIDFSMTSTESAGIDDDEDFDDEEEEELADATEVSFVLDDWNKGVKLAIKGVTDKEINMAKAVLHKTNKNGDGYEMTLSGRKELNPKQLSNAIDWDTQLLKAAADILCIAPKRNKKWTDEKTGKTYKTRSWFPELCGAGNYQAAKRFTLQMAAYVVLESERNFWTARFAWSVSDDFREAFRAFIGINEEVADSKVIGGQAQSWHWPLVKNDWTPTSSGRMTDEDYNNLDIGSLDTL